MKRSRLNRESKGLASRRREYRILGAKYLEEHPICECCGKLPSEQIHHRAGRLNEWLTYAPYFMAVNSACHRWITNNGKEAEARGWVIRVRTTFKEHIASLNQKDV